MAQVHKLNEIKTTEEEVFFLPPTHRVVTKNRGERKEVGCGVVVELRQQVGTGRSRRRGIPAVLGLGLAAHEEREWWGERERRRRAKVQTRGERRRRWLGVVVAHRRRRNAAVPRWGCGGWPETEEKELLKNISFGGVFGGFFRWGLVGFRRRKWNGCGGRLREAKMGIYRHNWGINFINLVGWFDEVNWNLGGFELINIRFFDGFDWIAIFFFLFGVELVVYQKSVLNYNSFVGLYRLFVQEMEMGCFEDEWNSRYVFDFPFSFSFLFSFSFWFLMLLLCKVINLFTTLFPYSNLLLLFNLT